MIVFGESIVLTYSWHKNYKHGICGHVYELIDYFYILDKFFDTKIFIVDLDINVFRGVIKCKYNFSDEYIEYIISKTITKTYNEASSNLLIASAFIITDGFYYEEHKFISTKNILITFPCYKRDMYLLNIKNLVILQDDRIYPKFKNTINYKKKILFEKIKKPEKDIDNKSLLYTTVGCRDYDISKYNPDEVICLTNGKRIPGYKYLDMPVNDLFSKFTKYIYTPVKNRFDCSPRLIAECKYFNKEVIYDIDYFDIGLESRKEDLSDLSKINLTEDDFLVNFLLEKNIKKK